MYKRLIDPATLILTLTLTFSLILFSGVGLAQPSLSGDDQSQPTAPPVLTDRTLQEVRFDDGRPGQSIQEFLSGRGGANGSSSPTDLESRTDAPAARIPLWESLDRLAPADRANAEIAFEGSSHHPPAVHAELAAIAALWNDGQYPEAIDRLRVLEEQEGIAGIAYGLSWRVPRNVDGSRWTNDIQLSTRTEIDVVTLDFDAATGAIFAAVNYFETLGHWSVNMSMDGGETWIETFYWTGVDPVNDISARVGAGYFYVGYTGPETTTQTEARLRRFFLADGSSDTDYFYYTVFDLGIEILDVELETNADYQDNRIYYFAVLADNSMQFQWALEDGTTWTDYPLGVTDAVAGFDVHWNQNFVAYPLFASYRSDTGWLHIVSISGATSDNSLLIDISGPTAIAAYDNRIMAAWEYDPGDRRVIEFFVSYDEGETWHYGVVDDPGADQYCWSPDLAARMNGGFSCAYQQEIGEPDQVFYRHRDYGTADPGPPWSSRLQINEADVSTGSPLAIEWLPPMPGYGYAHGVVWIGNLTDGAFFDRSDFLPGPDIEVSPPSLGFTLQPGSTGGTILTIANNGEPPLLWNIREQPAALMLPDGDTLPVDLRYGSKSLAAPTSTGSEREYEHLELGKGELDPRRGLAVERGFGGPDAFGYRWLDSDEPGGPAFAWVDITGVGTELVFGDDDYAEVPLPFPFPFYGVEQTMIKICSNGYLTFGGDPYDYTNDPIPDTIDPNDFIAPFWDDLYPPFGGTIHYYYDVATDRFIVQYTDIQHIAGIGTYTFEVILSRDGTILYQYLTLVGDVTQSTVGIENNDGTVGLEVVFNAPYLHDNLAIRIQDACPWLSESPLSGEIPGGLSQDVDIVASAEDLEPGLYECELAILSNDPDEPQVTVPVTLTVLNYPDIEVVAPPLYFSLPPGGFDCQTMTVSNLGDLDLIWYTFEQEAVLALPDGSGVPVSLKPSANPNGPDVQQNTPDQSDEHLELGKGEPDPRPGQAPQRGSGGPDAFGYHWIDSDDLAGPTFDWMDISGVGTPLVLLDDDYEEVLLPWPFPFYGFPRPFVRICSNGYLTFGADPFDYTNDPIPSTLDPNDFIAPFWEDLNPTLGGTIHYYHDAVSNRFIVQYTAVPRFGYPDHLMTFEVILDPDGTILYQYLDMVGTVDSATIGVENPDGTVGLQVVYNAPYVHNNLAVLIQDGCPWLTENPPGGVLAGGGVQPVDVCVNAADLGPGIYECSLLIASNDPDEPLIQLPVVLELLPTLIATAEIAATAPVSVYTLPNRNGQPLSSCYLYGGMTTDATITLTLTDGFGTPIQGFPQSDMWLETSLGGLLTCYQGSIADGPTDVNGQTTFSQPVAGGHWSNPAAGEKTIVMVLGNPIPQPGFDMYFNSPDISGDLFANLTDVVFFASDFLGMYNYRSDLYWDGSLNLSDVVLLAQGLGAVCPIQPAVASIVDDRSTIGVYFDRGASQRALTITPDEEFAAHLLVVGEAAAQGITGWQCDLTLSDNIVVHDWIYAAEGLNLASPPEFYCATGASRPLKAVGEVAHLLTITMHVVDSEPAHIYVSYDPKHPGESIAPVCAVGESGQLHSLSRPEGGMAAAPVAYINDAAGPQSAEVAFKKALTLDLRNEPNPFNPTTEIKFNLARDGQVQVDIYDISGRLIRRLTGGIMTAGSQVLHWDGRDHGGSPAASGIYFYKLFLNGENIGPTGKMSLIK